MSISSIGSSSIQSRQMQRPDPARMASDLFSKLNTDGSGGISASELESALSCATGASSTAAASQASSMIKGLDSDGDGQVSQDELTSGFKQLAQQFDDHFHASRTSGMGGAGDSASGAASSSSASGSTSYDPADANQDGTVSDAERLAYQQKTADSSSDASGAAASQNDMLKHMLKHMLMQLAHAYGGAQNTTPSGNTVSVAA